LVLGRAMSNTDTQDSPRPGLGGSHHLPPYSILCTSPWGPHPNDFFVPGLLSGSPEIAQVGTPALWSSITLRANLRLRCGLKQSYSPCRDLFNGMSHIICRQVNRIDSQLFLVRNQTSPSFGHNLCFRCPNEQCEPISNIYVPIAFQ
jgi:hypothetical protein